MKKFTSTDIREFLTPAKKPSFMTEEHGISHPSMSAVDLSNVCPKDMFTKLVVALRGMQIWFHGAHVLAKGTGFSGDHVNLFGRIYTEIDEQLDGAMEKAIGITGDESVICPQKIIEVLSKMKGLYGSPSDSPSIEIARTGLAIVEDFLTALEIIYLALKAQDMMTLGVEDFIAGLANTHEGYAYLLGQRVKNNLD